MSYNAIQTQAVQSDLTGRGTGVRHAGGGAMGGDKSMSPTAGYAQGPTGGLMVGGMNPQPGSMAHTTPMAASRQAAIPSAGGGGK